MSARHELCQVFRIYWSLLLGNIVEWYEFAVYGYLAPHLEKHFFSGSSLGVWLGFSVTFLARPLGGIILGWIGDKYGRSMSINISIIGMLLGTCGQGLLPTLDCGTPWLGNLGLVLLICLRFIQGISAAGEVGTISSYLAEVASPSTLSRCSSLINSTASVGFLSAQFMCFLMETLFGKRGVEDWAWRVPFILAIIPGGIAVVGRRGIPESSMFLEAQKTNEEAAHATIFDKLEQAFRFWPNMLITFGAVSTYAVLQYGCLVWIQSFLAEHGASASQGMVVGLITRCLTIFLGLPAGWLSDILGVGSVTAISSALVMVLGLPLWCIIASDPTSLLTTSLAFGLGFGLLSTLSGAVVTHFNVEMFPTEVRNTCIGLAYNVGFALFGGLAPFEATLLYEVHWTGPGFLYMFAGLGGLAVSLAARRLHATGALDIPYIRKAPFFGPIWPSTAKMDAETSSEFTDDSDNNACAV